MYVIPSFTVTTHRVLSLRAGDSALQKSVSTATPVVHVGKRSLLTLSSVISEQAVCVVMVVNQPHPLLYGKYMHNRVALLLGPLSAFQCWPGNEASTTALLDFHIHFGYIISLTWIHEDIVCMIHRENEVGVKLQCLSFTIWVHYSCGVLYIDRDHFTSTFLKYPDVSGSRRSNELHIGISHSLLIYYIHHFYTPTELIIGHT